MLKKTEKLRLRNFVEKISKLQPPSGKDIGLIVASDKKNRDNIFNFLIKQKSFQGIEMKDNPATTSFLKDFKKSLKKNHNSILKMGDYLSPKIYNQFYLISKEGRLHFWELKEDIVYDIPAKNQLVIIISQEDLDNLNYKNILNIVGPILRSN
jgi:hypothetical protein